MAGDAVADDEVVGGAIQVSVIRAAGDTGSAVPAGVHPQVDIVRCLIAIVRRSDNVGAGAGAAVLVLDIQLKIVVEVAFSADDIEGGGAILNYQQSFGIGGKCCGADAYIACAVDPHPFGIIRDEGQVIGSDGAEFLDGGDAVAAFHPVAACGRRGSLAGYFPIAAVADQGGDLQRFGQCPGRQAVDRLRGAGGNRQRRGWRSGTEVLDTVYAASAGGS